MRTAIDSIFLKTHNMAKIWFVKDGQLVHEGHLFREEPLKVCVNKLGVEPQHYRGEKDFRIQVEGKGKKANLEPAYRDAVCVVVELDENDVAGTSWKKGFYLPYGVRPNDVRKKLGQDR